MKRRPPAERIREDRPWTGHRLAGPLRRAGLAAFVLGVTAASAARAQDPAADSGAASAHPLLPRPAVGLVLSGGSAKGFAHIGVLRVLHREGVPVDVVTGTSMGAFVGGLFAIGYGPDQLAALATSQDWSLVFRAPVSRRELTPARKLAADRYVVTLPLRERRIELPAGVLSSQSAADLLARLTWPAHGDTDFTRFARPFAAVATDLATGDGVALTHGSLADALRASMALPTVFPPVAIAGHRYIDGGVARNLPADDARALGADLLICVDVSDPLAPVDSLRTILDVMDQTVAFRMQESIRAERARCDVLILPDIRGLPSSSFNAADQWIARGEAAARAALPQLKQLMDSLAHAGRAPAAEASVPAADVSRDDSVFVRAIAVRGGSAVAQRFARTQAGLHLPGWVTAETLAGSVTRIYASGHFDNVTWALEPGAEGATVVFTLVPGDPGQFGIGVRFDSQYQAALLASATLHNTLVYGSTVQLDLRLGEPREFEAQFIIGGDAPSRWVRRLRATYLAVPLDLYAGGRAVATERITTGTFAALAGRVLAHSAVLAVELKGEVARHNPLVAPPESLAATQNYLSASGIFWLDTFDRTALPTRGGSIILQAEAADRSLGSGATFARALADTRWLIPVARRTSLMTRLSVGQASGPDLPRQLRFYLGGTTPAAAYPTQFFSFYGLAPQERAGTRLVRVQVGVQHAFGDLVAQLRWNAGSTFDRWPAAFHAGDYARGLGLTLAALSPAGPLSVTAAWHRASRAPDITVDFGFRF